MNSLGYFKEYGWLIITVALICYMALYTYLCSEYGEIDHDE